jgi:hypothetical protein
MAKTVIGCGLSSGECEPFSDASLHLLASRSGITALLHRRATFKMPSLKNELFKTSPRFEKQGF